MARLIWTKDWSRTPLGPFARWPQSLLTTVSLAQASNSPISLIWGRGHTQIYNDGYWPICGAKHPHSMGQDFRECWASAFPVVGEAYETAWSGQSAYLESMRMFLDRFGSLEETWFTFSFSPITDESGGVGGLFHPVTEMTGQMLSERRTKTLRDLANQSGKARDTEAAFGLVAQTLASAELDVPFALIYWVSNDGATAQLVAQSNLAADTAASPRTIDLRAPGGVWPVARVAHTGAAVTIEDVANRLGGIAVGPYPEPPRLAFALPILQPGTDRPAAVMIAGVSARLRMSDLYRGFYDVLAAGVGAALANARAHEDERRRVEVLAELDRAKTAFFSNVSHEFRTPLTLILGPLEDELAQRERPLPFARRHRLDTAHRNALRLLKLVNTLLDFSRLEAGRVQARFQPTELGALTAELASVFRSALDKAGLRLVIECPPLPESVFVDRDMWEKIVLNLISNAFKHTFEGAIEVRLAWRGDRAELTVADTGIGIRADELPRLFERFHRVQGARSRSHEGTGIGLALVQELARLHGGAVEVTSAVGEGTRFRVTIPGGRDHLPVDRVELDHLPAVTATRAAAFVEEALHWIPFDGRATTEIPVEALAAGLVERNPAAPAAPARRSPSWTGAPPDRPDEPSARSRILWADDNADMRDYVARLLLEHYDVCAVGDGLAALAAARRDPPDLVLTDIMMPGLDGLGLLRELRGDPATHTVPVILLSARAGEESALEGLNARADDYLLKPFSARELLARVRTHVELGRIRRQWASELERANKELETFSYSVSHDLRSPLRAMDGFAALLLAEQGDQLDDQGRQYIARIRAASQRMAAIIDDLLALSRVSRGEIVPSPIDLGELAGQVVADLRARDPARDTEVEIADGLAAIGDPHLVTIALENLIGNAWKFTARREGARIWFGREQGSRESVFTVRDNGSGFDMAYAEKLFVPFQRLHTEADFEGTGIGLATVRRIVTRHGGRIWADAAVGRGATFFFTLGRVR